MRARQTKQPAVAVPAVPSPEPLLVTTAVAAELLSISPWEVRRLVRKGQLAHKKLSRTNWLISMSSIKKFAVAS
jgi:excisionase family DNA binding protein